MPLLSESLHEFSINPSENSSRLGKNLQSLHSKVPANRKIWTQNLNVLRHSAYHCI